MAQWLGQYTGRTHETRVKAIEDSLRVSINASRSAASEDAPRKLKATIGLAKKLYTARLKVLKVRRENLIGSALCPNSPCTSKLHERILEIEGAGVAGILAEFGMDDILRPDSDTE